MHVADAVPRWVPLTFQLKKVPEGVRKERERERRKKREGRRERKEEERRGEWKGKEEKSILWSGCSLALRPSPVPVGAGEGLRTRARVGEL